MGENARKSNKVYRNGNWICTGVAIKYSQRIDTVENVSHFSTRFLFLACHALITRFELSKNHIETI